jgi:hypothetical protein
MICSKIQFDIFEKTVDSLAAQIADVATTARQIARIAALMMVRANSNSWG